MGVSQVGQRLQILAVAVPVGNPRHGDQLRPVVHHLGEGFGRCHAVHVPDDARLDAPGLGQLAIHHQRRHVVEIVDHHVVPGLQVQGVDHDVLAFTRGRDQSDLPDLGPDEARELLPHGFLFVEHLPQQDRIAGLGREKLDGLVHRGLRRWTDVRRVQIQGFVGDREIRAHAERVVAGRRQGGGRCSRGIGRGLIRFGAACGPHDAGEGRRGRNAHELPSRYGHELLLLLVDMIQVCA